MKVLLQYLLKRKVGEEDPILVVSYTNEFELVLSRPLSLHPNFTELIVVLHLTIAARKRS